MPPDIAFMRKDYTPSNFIVNSFQGVMIIVCVVNVFLRLASYNNGMNYQLEED